MADPSPLATRLEFPFPARDPHAGIPLSNGTFGALIWSEGATVRITINRADYWDHRGGLEFSSEATFANLRKWLEAGDEARLRAVFEGSHAGESGSPPHPTRLPMGRVELRLPDGWRVASGGLHLATGEAELELECSHPTGRAKLRASLLRDTPVLCLRITGVDGSALAILSRPPDAPEVAAYWAKYGLPPAQAFDLDEFGGWVQECPGEPAMCAGWLRHAANGGLLLYITSVYGETPADARRNALETLEAVRGEGYTPATLRSFAWWRRWWDQSARVELPDATLEGLYYLGMYKLGGLSVPGGPAATLQGPWVEDHRMPPWSSDYHFNINVQECYWPCFGGNHPECMEPLIGLLKGWLPRLRENARVFTGVEEGLQLPHSTDDRGTAMSGFWTGFVDHGSTAWIGQLLWLYWRYTGDREFLRETAYPFMKGALRVYEGMLEEEGGRLVLPVSVSPEFGGSGFGAWGRNASFQLALIHFLCRALWTSAQILEVDEEECAHWADIEERLPLGAIGNGPELLLWEGQALTESHRHHSHLAGIHPFDIFDPVKDATLIRNSLRRWTRMGMGMWTGWCVPWAAMLHARVGQGEMAALLLETFRRVFMGPGHASTHDAVFPGFTVMDGRPEVMQIEAAEGAAAAVLEMLAHTAGGVLRVFPAVPRAWPFTRFQRLRAEGAFEVLGEWERGAVTRLEIRSLAGMPLRLANPWEGTPVLVQREGAAPTRHTGKVLEIPTQAGELLRIQPGAR